MHNPDELDHLKAELQHIITTEETEIELLQHATGRTAQVAIAIRSEIVNRLKETLG